jgi:ATPase subunit of ABC transporter with duplicated ATPase domains
MHIPIQLKNLSLEFVHKTCFEDFSATLPYGSRVAIIGRNGSGKSSLLKLIADLLQASDLCIGYVPQVITDYSDLSGGQRFNKALTQALSKNPDLLLLDEPTNHLDLHNRKSLMRMLNAYHGTLLIVSHDVELLQKCIDTIWHIENQHITVFSGKYTDYIQESKIKLSSLQKELEILHKQKKDMHLDLMQEQVRAKKSKAKGQKSIAQSKWPTIVSNAKATRAEATSGNKKAALSNKKVALTEQLKNLYIPEIIKPKFALTSAEVGTKTIIAISNGSVGYNSYMPLLTEISLSLAAGERIAIVGDNASGKTTLVKAISSNPEVIAAGEWMLPQKNDIGYLDQHYATLQSTKTVLETITELVPEWSHTKTRLHLSDFLFRGNDAVNALVASLSGGEKAKLCLAQIAAKTPKLLILDEITNNLDLETREHVLQVLQNYPGAMIVISHDEKILRNIGIKEQYMIIKSKLYMNKIV